MIKPEVDGYYLTKDSRVVRIIGVGFRGHTPVHTVIYYGVSIDCDGYDSFLLKYIKTGECIFHESLGFHDSLSDLQLVNRLPTKAARLKALAIPVLDEFGNICGIKDNAVHPSLIEAGLREGFGVSSDTEVIEVCINQTGFQLHYLVQKSLDVLANIRRE